MSVVVEQAPVGTEPGGRSSWRGAGAGAAVLAASGLAALLLGAGELVVPVVVIIVAYLGVAGGLRWSTSRWPLRVGFAVGVLSIGGNLPAVASGLAHPESFASFAPTLTAAVGSAMLTICCVVALRRAGGSPRPVLAGGGALVVVAVLGSLAASLSLEDDTAEPGDVVVGAFGAEYPEVLEADAGRIGFLVDNEDRIRHTFLIEGTGVDLEVPGSTARRTVAELAPGTYRYYCDVPGHEAMQGVIVVS